jgi:hypothetical protein
MCTMEGWIIILGKLSLIKDGYPLKVAEYSFANKLGSEPAFSWWVHDVLRKRDRIFSKLNSRYLRREEQVWNCYTEDSKRGT